MGVPTSPQPAAPPPGRSRAVVLAAATLFVDGYLGALRKLLPVTGAHPYGLWSGLSGVCCLALDLIHQTEAGFPGFEG